MVLEKTLRVLCIARRSNQSILNKISPEYSLEGLMMKLKLQYFGHLMQRANLLEKGPDAGKNWRQEEKGMMDELVGWYHWLNGHEFEQTQGDGEVVKDRKTWCAAVNKVTESTEQQLPCPYEPFLITNQSLSLIFLCLSVYVHTYTCVCTHMCTYTYTHVCTHTYMYTYVYAHAYVYTYTHVYVRAHTHVYVHTQIHIVYTQWCMCTYILLVLFL